MPQVILAMIAGAGFYAASRWVAKVLEEQEELARRQASQDVTPRSRPPIDLGALEWDETAGVYRPQDQTRH
jgi:hypothetical protein